MGEGGAKGFNWFHAICNKLNKGGCSLLEALHLYTFSNMFMIRKPTILLLFCLTISSCLPLITPSPPMLHRNPFLHLHAPNQAQHFISVAMVEAVDADVDVVVKDLACY